MELRHLRYFIAVAEELHFGRAALRLGIAQPALSQRIRRLEEELQAPLLRRTKRHVELTEAGRIFLQEARATLVQAERAARLAQRATRGEIGQLGVGFVPWTDITSIPKAISTFGERYPEVELELQSLTASKQISALREGRINIGFTRPPTQCPDLMTKALFSEPLIVVFPPRHPFAGYRRVPWRLLGSEPYISFSERWAPCFAAVIGEACRQAGIALKVRHEVDQPQTVLALVEAGIGVSLVPASFARLTRPGIAHRGLRPVGPSLETVLAWRRDDRSRILQAFIRVVDEIVGPARRPR